MYRLKLLVSTILIAGILCGPTGTLLAVPKAKDGVNEPEAQGRPSSTFEAIENKGGREVSDSRLSQKRGEGLFSAAVGAATGALTGSVTGVGHYLWNKSVIDREVPDVHEVGRRARQGAVIGATSGAFFGSFGL